MMTFYATVTNDVVPSPLVVMDKLEKGTLLDAYEKIGDLADSSLNMIRIVCSEKNWMNYDELSFSEFKEYLKNNVLDEEYTVIHIMSALSEEQFFLFQGRDIYTHLSKVNDAFNEASISEWSALCITDDDRQFFMSAGNAYTCRYCGSDCGEGAWASSLNKSYICDDCISKHLVEDSDQDVYEGKSKVKPTSFLSEIRNLFEENEGSDQDEGETPLKLASRRTIEDVDQDGPFHPVRKMNHMKSLRTID